MPIIFVCHCVKHGTNITGLWLNLGCLIQQIHVLATVYVSAVRINMLPAHMNGIVNITGRNILNDAIYHTNKASASLSGIYMCFTYTVRK